MENLPDRPKNLPGNFSDRLRKYRQASKADETKRALKKNWTAFDGWCDGFGMVAFPTPPAVLESYLVHLAEKGMKAATIDQARWAVDTRHRLASLPLPGDTNRIRVVMAGIKRTLGTRPARKAALTIEHLRTLHFPDSLRGKRDKALLLLGFAGGFRRSELTRLQISDLVFEGRGLQVLLASSKTDQEGRGELVGIVPGVARNHCPVTAVREWIEAAKLEDGALFRSLNRGGRPGVALSTVSIGKIVKAAAASCGLDPALFGAHSLRAGCATYLLEKGVPLNVVAKQGRWKRADTVLRYDRGNTARALEGVY